MKIKNVFGKILPLLILLISCSKTVDVSEKPKWEKCSVFNLSTNSGHRFKITKYKDHTASLWDMQYLKFNADSIVIDTIRMLLDKRDVNTIVYKQECFPSYIQ